MGEKDESNQKIPMYHYTLEEFMALNPKDCTISEELLKRIPKKILTCCNSDQCKCHQLRGSKSKVLADSAPRNNDGVNDEKRLPSNRNKKSPTNEQSLPDEIIIAELSDVSDSERSAEHSQHCCIHKNNVKISVDDLVRYKTRKTQPPYLAHENAVVNPKRIVSKEHLENIISSKSSTEKLVMSNDKTKSIQNNFYDAPSAGPKIKQDNIISSNSEDTPFSRILKKIKEKGLVPKPIVPVPTQRTLTLDEQCPIHHKCSAEVCQIKPPNRSALTDNFQNALSMCPPVLRRKMRAISKATSTSSDIRTSGTSIGSQNIQDDFQRSSAVGMAATAAAQGKTVVPTGTLEKILNLKTNSPPFTQINPCAACTCHQHQQSLSSQRYYHNPDEIIDLRQLESLQLNDRPNYYSNAYSTSSRHVPTNMTNTINKENHQSNEEDNLNFKNLVKQALTKDTKPESTNSTGITVRESDNKKEAQ